MSPLCDKLLGGRDEPDWLRGAAREGRGSAGRHAGDSRPGSERGERALLGAPRAGGLSDVGTDSRFGPPRQTKSRTGLRFHPGELLLSLPIRLVAVVVLGAPAVGVLAFEVVFTFANLVEHGDIDHPQRGERVLGRVFVTAALLREALALPMHVRQ